MPRLAPVRTRVRALSYWVAGFMADSILNELKAILLCLDVNIAADVDHRQCLGGNGTAICCILE
jgi:hypothetical protein